MSKSTEPNDQAIERIQKQLQGKQDMQEQVQALRAAAQQAGNPELAQQLRDPKFIETLFDSDIAREDENDDLDREVKVLLSRIHALGNITDDEHERLKTLNPNRVEQIKAELPNDIGPGSKCVGEVREIMTGESGRPRLTPEKARRLENVGEVRTTLQSLSKDAKGFEGVTEISTSIEADTGESSS